MHKEMKAASCASYRGTPVRLPLGVTITLERKNEGSEGKAGKIVEER